MPTVTSSFCSYCDSDDTRRVSFGPGIDTIYECNMCGERGGQNYGQPPPTYCGS